MLPFYRRHRVYMVKNVVLSVMLRNALYSDACRNATTVAHLHDYKVEMESDEERKKLTRVKCSDTVEQKMTS